MTVARSTKETFDFVTVADRAQPREKQTTFHLRRLSTAAVIRLRDLRDGNDPAIGSWMTFALRAGLAGWSNFNDPDGQPVPFVADKSPATLFGLGLIVAQTASEDSINRLSISDASDIALAIMTGNELTADDVKN